MDSNSISCKKQRQKLLKSCILKFTILFAAAALFLVCPYLLQGKSLVNSGDGMMQHIKALDYYGRWLRSIAGRIMQGDLSLPAYSFAFGYGGDVITTLHYYAIGDPLTLLSVFFDTAHIVYLYDALIVVRLYLAGIMFLLFAVYTVPDDPDRSLASYPAGAMIYAFCGYALFTATRHPFFLNPLIYFPLLLLGVERSIREKKTGLLTISTALAAAVNFYFFYMIVLLTVCYVLWRMLSDRNLKGLSDKSEVFLRIAFGTILGVMLACILFLPVVLRFLQNPRLQGGALVPIHYNKEYYAEFVLSFLTPFTNGFWTHLGITGIGTAALAVLVLSRAKYRKYKILLAGELVLLALPAAGYILSGASYVTNRWSWAFVFFACWVLILLWEEMRRLPRMTLIILAGGFCLCCMVALFLRGHISRVALRNLLFELIIFALLLLLLGWSSIRKMSGRAFSGMMLCLIMGSLAGNIWSIDHDSGKNNLQGTIEMNQMTNRLTAEDAERILEKDPAAGIEQLRSSLSSSPWNTMGLAVRLSSRIAQRNGQNTDPSGDFLLDRYTGRGIRKNESVIDGLPSVHYYWSLSNGAVARYLDEIANNTYRSYDYRSMDDRALTLALMGTQYYVSEAKAYVPFGYERLSPEENPLDDVYPVYRNQYALPLGYTFEKVIPEEAYQSMDALERQEAMLQGIVMSEKDIASLEEKYALPELEEIAADSVEVPFTVEAEEGLVFEDGRITVKKAGARVTLSFDSILNAETCLYVRNLQYENGGTKAEITVEGCRNGKTITKKTLTVLTPEHDWYAGRHDFIVNTGYDTRQRDAIILEFPSKGTYMFDSLQVSAQPMEQYASRVRVLAQDSLKNVDLHADEDTFTGSFAEGSISLKKPKVLCFALPYDKGWSARVDGQPVGLLCGNRMFLALPLEAGDHQIELRYRTPGLAAGTAISLCAAVLLIIIAIRRKKYFDEAK